MLPLQYWVRRKQIADIQGWEELISIGNSTVQMSFKVRGWLAATITINMGLLCESYSTEFEWLQHCPLCLIELTDQILDLSYLIRFSLVKIVLV